MQTYRLFDQVTAYTPESSVLYPCFDDPTGNLASCASTSPSPTQSLDPMSPEPPLHSLSPEPPLNPLVFLPQYELSHLDLGGEVELEENFTEGRVMEKMNVEGLQQF